jgi:hypothetical protein
MCNVAGCLEVPQGQQVGARASSSSSNHHYHHHLRRSSSSSGSRKQNYMYRCTDVVCCGVTAVYTCICENGQAQQALGASQPPPTQQPLTGMHGAGPDADTPDTATALQLLLKLQRRGVLEKHPAGQQLQGAVEKLLEACPLLSGALGAAAIAAAPGACCVCARS